MKVRNWRLEIFTGSSPTALTNASGKTVEEWAETRGEEELIEPPLVEEVGGELWLIIQYTES